ncbi:MAG TPA: 6,7-dimethyl-8-ribityllumazine synthase [Acidimicrobiales bacterium]|jgi:6,7-dimethyl-8-ribityllumazine synthase|nr:6,7-dimethyl-8-ribityllumazine synthase [Acidimicrobiales bacterium]
MSRDVVASTREAPALDGRGLRVAMVCARFNDHVTTRLVEGARRGLKECHVADGDITEVWVPGAFELPLVAKALAESGRVDAVICLGCVIRGETAHFEHVAGQAASGIQRVALDTGLPIVFGVLTTENLDQALARSGDAAEGENVGESGAHTAVEMARLVTSITKSHA